MELPRVTTEPELPEHGLQAEAAPVSPKKTKKKKKEKWLGETLALGAEVAEAAFAANFEPQVAPAPSKKKEKGQKVIDPPSKMIDPRESEESKAGAIQGSTKKKKKEEEDQESGV